MNCTECLHSDRAHAKSPDGDILTGLGRCRIPGCECSQFQNAIPVIDEELT